MNKKKEFALIQRVRAFSLKAFTFWDLENFIKDIAQSYDIATSIECLNLIQDEIDKRGQSILEPELCQKIINWFPPTCNFAQSIFPFFENKKVKLKPVCQTWFSNCLIAGHKQSLEWLIKKHSAHFDYNKAKFALKVLKHRPANAATIYYC